MCCCFRIVSNVLGRPFGIQGNDIDAKLPTASNDEIMAFRIEDDFSDMAYHYGGRTSIFVHIVRYRLLCGKIVTAMHGQADKQAEGGIGAMRGVRDDLARDLAEWKSRAADLDLSVESPHASCFLSRAWFDMIYHNAMLMLYRPSPKLDVSRDSVALQHIFFSAKQSINFYSILHRSRRLNQSWLTLQAVFMSGLSYIFAVSMHFRERRRMASASSVFDVHQGQGFGLLRSDPSTLEVVNDTRACSNILMAVSERWTAQRHCSEVFNRLSDAALADVIKSECDARAHKLVQSVVPPTAISQTGDIPRRETAISMFTPPEASMGIPHDVNGTGQTPRSWDKGMSALQRTGQGEVASSSPLSQLAVDAEFRHTFDDFQVLYDREQVDYSVYQLSQAWYDSFDMQQNSVSVLGTEHDL